MWESDLSLKIEKEFFQVVAVSVLLYGCTTQLDGNYTRILRAVQSKSWKQPLTKQQLYSHLPPISQTIQVRQVKYSMHSWRSKDELTMVSCGPLHSYIPALADQKKKHHHFVDTGCLLEDLTEVIAFVTDEGKESRKSMLSACLDDDDDDDEYYISIFIKFDNFLHFISSVLFTLIPNY